MAAIFSKFKRLLLKVQGLIPSLLPITDGALEKFSSSLLDTYNLPNEPAWHQHIANMIMHLGHASDRKSKHYFARCVRKQMANERAYYVVHLAKEAAKKQREVDPKPKAPDPLVGEITQSKA